MSADYTGRPLRPSDRDAALALYDSNVPDFFHEEERADYLAWLDDPGGPVVVLEGPGGVAAVGGVAMEADGQTGSLCWGIVRRDLHGRGLGAALLEARLAILAGNPACLRVRLSTLASTAGFFARAGFRTVRVEPDGHGPGADAWEMELVLTDAVRRRLEVGRVG